MYRLSTALFTLIVVLPILNLYSFYYFTYSLCFHISVIKFPSQFQVFSYFFQVYLAKAIVLVNTRLFAKSLSFPPSLILQLSYAIKHAFIMEQNSVFLIISRVIVEH